MKKVIFSLMMLVPISILASNNVEIKGKVMDIHTNMPLFESHVYLNDNYGVLTDENGFFSIEIPKGMEKELLYISYVGYETYFKPINEINQEFIVVSLIEEIGALEEVIVFADPWNEFREIISDLSSNYKSEDEFYAALLKELKQLEFDTKANHNQNASVKGGNLSFIIMSLIILIGFIMIAKPLIVRVDNLSTNQRGKSMSIS